MIVPRDKPSLSKPRVTLVPKRVAVVRPEVREEPITTNSPRISPAPRVCSVPATTNDIDVSVANSKKPLSDAPINQTKPNTTSRCPQVIRESILFRVIIIIVIVIVCITAIVVPTVILLVPRADTSSSSATNITASVCLSTTCIGSETPYRTSSITALFLFDGNYNDLFGMYYGFGFGSPLPTFGASTNYIRLSVEMYLADNQYTSIPDVNIRQRSFTIELWFLLSGSGTATDSGIFSQCGSDAICFGLSVRSGRVILSFDAMNSSASVLIGTSICSVSNWYHLAVVYDAALRQQLIYINGHVDAVSSGMVNPYQGAAAGVITRIGRSSSFNYPSSNFNGLIDHVIISAGVARTSCQILNDATLFAYYPFDSTDTVLDRGVNLLHGIATGTSVVTAGRIEQAISFDTNTSYFQAQAFPCNGPNGMPFSVALWVKPSAVVGGGSLVHISTSQSGTGSVCYDLLGFTTTGVLVAQMMASAVLLNSVQGTILPVDTWTHLTVIYSTTNGLRLLINGQLVAATTSGVMINQNNIFITLGHNGPGFIISSGVCLASTIAARSYRGMIDDFRVYSRELDAQEVCVLVNNG